MASRMKIILLSAIPVGASILYLLWTYTWRKRASRDRAIELKKVCHLSPLSESAEISDVAVVQTENNETKTNDVESIRSTRHMSGSDAGNFSLSDEVDLLSSSRGLSPAGDPVDLQNVSPHSCETSAIVLGGEHDVNFDTRVDEQLNSSVDYLRRDLDRSVIEVCKETNKTSVMQEDGLSRDTNKDVDIVKTMASFDSACNPCESVVVEESVEACQPVVTKPTVEFLAADVVVSEESEKYSWGNSAMPDNVEPESVCENDVKNDSEEFVTTRKESIDSVSIILHSTIKHV